MAYPSRVVPPPARWQGEAAHVGVADYAPEGSDVFMRLYYPTLSKPPRRGPLWVPSVHYAHGMAHFRAALSDFEGGGAWRLAKRGTPNNTGFMVQSGFMRRFRKSLSLCSSFLSHSLASLALRGTSRVESPL